MGRVYNALVRAERWQDRSHLIGSIAQADEEASRADEQAAVVAFNVNSPAAAHLDIEEVFAARESNARPAPCDVPAAQRGTLQTARSSNRFPRESDLERETAIAGPPVAVFEEPSQISDIRNLSVDPHLVAMTGADSPALERYRSLAVRLLNLADRRKLKTMLITSAEAAEGKTTVAASVAWLLAKRPGRRVLLIDAGRGYRSLTRALGIDARRGWLDLANGSCGREQAITRLDPNGLYVLTPGAIATPAGDWLSSSLEVLIADLAPSFELVVVDSDAIVESAETQRLAALVDGAVIVARAGRTHRSKVAAARKLVPKERRLGIVLNELEGEDMTDRRNTNPLGRLFRRKRKPSLG